MISNNITGAAGAVELDGSNEMALVIERMETAGMSAYEAVKGTIINKGTAKAYFKRYQLGGWDAIGIVRRGRHRIISASVEDRIKREQIVNDVGVRSLTIRGFRDRVKIYSEEERDKDSTSMPQSSNPSPVKYQTMWRSLKRTLPEIVAEGTPQNLRRSEALFDVYNPIQFAATVMAMKTKDIVPELLMNFDITSVKLGDKGCQKYEITILPILPNFAVCGSTVDCRFIGVLKFKTHC